MQVVDDLSRAEEAVEALSSSIQSREIKMSLMTGSGTRQEFTFVQETLGFVPVQQFFLKIRKEIKNFVTGEYGIKLGELFRGDLRKQMQMPTDMSGDAVDNVVAENESIILAFLKLVEVVPALELDVIALSLGIPDKQHEWFKEAISMSPSRGGLTIDDGFDILRWFVRQNAVAVRRFFEDQATSLVKEFDLAINPEKANAKAKEPEPEETETKEQASTGGTPSSTSSPDTPASVLMT